MRRHEPVSAPDRSHLDRLYGTVGRQSDLSDGAVSLSAAGPAPLPFTVTVTGLGLTWGLMRHDLLRLGPLAHRLVANSIQDGILVLDRSERLVDANPAARRILPGRFDELVGRSVTELLPAWDLNASEDARLEMKLPSPVGEVLYEASGVPVRGRRGAGYGASHCAARHQRSQTP